ncbi:MAG: serine protease [gamma proteobacterium symbiont of Bathyaustriella thionipta]|nr:serine protease [gamma proteobacterium symbiont of Bathyaustriella thionipta]MCU7951009.1 serine protease [gamma proteobacterium symbiont of Bathyaustriella thionipta]MCU7953950.1 serine protease [gamma proteobacterium symbiont of Bathyaustriella thionipta]MCU7957519.1 serine protease [gamma proteobacterium symbiont of Bathyaustriella thionipta]MCU7968343.1 serine protease [gamma proteobacterium symbiont of Bathyaustriella thionipta]
MKKHIKPFLLFLFALLIFTSNQLSAQTLPQVIKQIKPSIVGVGTLQATRRPPSKLMGTGFVVADGYHVITNYHVIPKQIKTGKKEQLVIFYRDNKQVKYRKVSVLAQDKEHDLALLRIEGRKFPALKVETSRKPQEGETIAFTGFPIGAVLGLYPVTHRGVISSISPVVIPAPSSSTLSVAMIKRLKNPYFVYQLDATAYPGNSGSPMFDSTNGKVLGVINKVFIKKSKESILQKPSGITYAIPGKYIIKLLTENKIKGN